MEKRAVEDVLRRLSGTHDVVKEEKRFDYGGEEESCGEENTVAKVGNKRPYPESENDDMKPITSSKQKDLSSIIQGPVVSKAEKSSMEHDSMVSSATWKEQDDQLESARAKMGEVKEENQRLKMYLNRIMKDYQTPQMQFYEIVHDQEAAKKSSDSADNTNQEIEEPDHLVLLSLGRALSSDSKKDEKSKASSQEKEDDEQDKEEGLTLGLDCKFEVSKTDATEPLPNPSPENSTSQEPKEEASETWPPSKVLKTTRSGDDEVLEQNTVKKARVSVRARCDTPTMNDGCQWRKYGQKIAKGNPCPRAYYRCTVAPSCPVRKQVQRCADDMSILITTYEGTHNHPLPMSATAMASTTSAAASMLLSGSSSSSHPSGSSNSSLLAATTPANLHGLNFYLSNNSKSKQFYLPTNSSFSSSTSYPTITLDLTTSSTVPSSSSSSPFNRMFSSATSAYPQAPRYPPTSLNFSTSSSEYNSNNTVSWGSNGFLSHGNTQVPYVKNQYGSASALNLGRQQSMENNPNIFQSFMQKNNNLINNPPPQSLPPDTIAAATKAITADPGFQSALAAALTSIIGNGSSSIVPANQSGGDNLGQKLKLLQSGDHQTFPVGTAGFSATSKGNGCASSYLNNPTSTATQQGSLMFMPAPSLPFSNSKSASASPGDTRDHNN